MDVVFRSVTKDIVDVLGDDVTYIYASGEKKIVKAIFDYAYIETFNHTTRDPVLMVPTEYLEPRVADKVICESKLFEIVAIEPDNVGITVCQLTRV